MEPVKWTGEVRRFSRSAVRLIYYTCFPWPMQGHAAFSQEAHFEADRLSVQRGLEPLPRTHPAAHHPAEAHPGPLFFSLRQLAGDSIPRQGAGRQAQHHSVPPAPHSTPRGRAYGPLFRLEQLRLAAFDPTEVPDTESYLWQLRSNFIRMTDRDCVLPEHGLEEQARVLFGELAKIGALEVLENG